LLRIRSLWLAGKVGAGILGAPAPGLG